MPPETASGTPRRNKRNYPRAPLAIRIRYGSESGGLKDGFSGIMGGGGISIETVHPLPIGSEIVMEFSLPGKTGHVRVEGLVVWVRNEFDPKGLAPGMGIQFKRISAADREKILDLVMRILMGEPDIEI
jgi:uncharacterized protein (TIGR02266 family)